jgi:hypothetical protein
VEPLAEPFEVGDRVVIVCKDDDWYSHEGVVTYVSKHACDVLIIGRKRETGYLQEDLLRFGRR